VGVNNENKARSAQAGKPDTDKTSTGKKRKVDDADEDSSTKKAKKHDSDSDSADEGTHTMRHCCPLRTEPSPLVRRCVLDDGGMTKLSRDSSFKVTSRTKKIFCLKCAPYYLIGDLP